MLSRCKRPPMARTPDLELPFALRAREIARAEGLDGRPLEDYLGLARGTRCNLRSMLDLVESGAMLTRRS
jgi:hypothetical protein